MNNKMFQKIINQTNLKIDFSNTNHTIPNSLKIIFKEERYVVYLINAKQQATLIIQADNEKKMYKEVLKYLGIKLDHHGKIMKNNIVKQK